MKDTTSLLNAGSLFILLPFLGVNNQLLRVLNDSSGLIRRPTIFVFSVILNENEIFHLKK